jgi:hypothetical protein
LAGSKGLYRLADCQYSDHAAISENDSRLFAIHAEVQRPAQQRVLHVALPRAVKRRRKDLIGSQLSDCKLLAPKASGRVIVDATRIKEPALRLAHDLLLATVTAGRIARLRVGAR